MNQEKAIASLQHRINIYRQSIHDIEDKIKALERAIQIIQVPTQEVVTNELQILQYPKNSDIELKFLYAVTSLDRFVTKQEILEVLKLKEQSYSYESIVNNTMRVLQTLIRHRKLVLVRFNNSNLLSFYGYQKWLSVRGNDSYYISPDYEPAIKFQAKIIRETADFVGIDLP